MYNFIVAHNHIGRLGVMHWLLVLVWALTGPMVLRTTIEAAISLLVLLEGLLSLLLKVGILLDIILSLGLVGIEVPLMYHIGSRRAFHRFSIGVLCSRVLLNTQMADDVLY